MAVKKPIFIVGVGRNGSSLLHSIFAEHPNVIWLSGVCRRWPNNPAVNRIFLKAVDYPLIGAWLKTQATPGEHYDFWEYHCKGFSTPCRDLTAQDVTEKTKRRMPQILGQMVTGKRNRHLFKITGWPRIGFLQAIFPDAKFIHLIRSGTAVANSLLDVKFWNGWQGPENWRLGMLTPQQQVMWNTHDRSFVVLAAIYWMIIMDAMEDARMTLRVENFLQIKYETLCLDPVATFKEMVSFCELDWTPEFEKTINRYEIHNQNTKWQQDLTKQQQEMLQTVLADHLSRYDYLND